MFLIFSIAIKATLVPKNGGNTFALVTPTLILVETTEGTPTMDESTTRYSMTLSIKSHRNFLLAAYYNGTQKYMDNAGMERSWRCDDYGLQAVYGNGNVRVQVTLDNIFRSRDRGWKKTVADHYACLKDWTSQGTTVKISFSYTFDYGKKVDRSIDISGPEDTATSILGSGDK